QPGLTAAERPDNVAFTEFDRVRLIVGGDTDPVGVHLQSDQHGGGARLRACVAIVQAGGDLLLGGGVGGGAGSGPRDRAHCCASFFFWISASASPHVVMTSISSSDLAIFRARRTRSIACAS